MMNYRCDMRARLVVKQGRRELPSGMAAAE